MICRICGSESTATIHADEPERGCKLPDDHHPFVADEDEET